MYIKRVVSEESNSYVTTCALHPADTDASPGENEDIELIERALEKALQVRTGSGPSKKKPKEASQKKTHTPVVTSKEGTQSSGASKVKQSSRSTSNFSSIGRTEHIHKNGM